ncbi:ATP-dependent Clp protease proteolytic subunit [Oenococcus oeni]|uniref:ATP-dependent Clp protease proteolytic subunit n=1 Tax=Oenococcus oeni TaxID=1247 RepID=UPI00214AC8C8|nr:ATP-dependent Clp protease proteolytic subunit [Oenococcus oeni]
MSATSPSDIIDQLPTTGEDVTVEVASDGGEVDAATQIAGALQQYKGQVNVQILSNAYSAGTIVAMGGNVLYCRPLQRSFQRNKRSIKSEH